MMHSVITFCPSTKCLNCFYESNTRPHEFLNLKWTDIDPQCIPIKKRDNNGNTVETMMDVVYLNVDGKTGPRRTFVVFSVPFLVAWKKAYPKGADGYIWIDIENNLEQLKYAAANKVVRSAAKRAGISENIKLYSFRHGKNTEVSEVLSYA